MSIFRSGSSTRFVIDGDRIREGDSCYGEVKYTIDGDRIREGDTCYGKTIANVGSDGIIREGSGSWGRIIGRVEK